jgi:hypothetical protein
MATVIATVFPATVCSEVRREMFTKADIEFP